MCETYENVKQTCIKRDVDVYWERRLAWERDGDGDGDGGGDGHADGDQNVVKKYKNPKGCVAFCRLRDGTKSGARISGTLCFLKFAKILKKMQKIKLLKSYGMCRFLPPPGRHQKWSANLRYLVFFETRKNFENDEKHKNVKII